MVRRDPLMLMALQILSRLFFFQPMFILARKRLTDLAELAADEWAAKQLADARAVATALFTCATRIQENRQIQWGLAMAGNKSMLKTRVERLIGAERLPFKNAGIAAKGGLTAGMIVLALGLPSIQFAEAMTAEKDLDGNWDIEVADRDSEHVREHVREHARERAKEHSREAAAHAWEFKRQQVENAYESAHEAERNADLIAQNLIKHSTGISNAELRSIGINNVRGTLELDGGDFSFTSEDGKERAHADGDRRSVSITHDDDGSVSGNMVWVNGGYVVKADWDGTFELTDDESGVKRLAKGGELELETKGEGPRRRIRYEEKNGRIETTYWVDGNKTTLDRDGQKWVAKTLLTLTRETGLNADKRVARILKQDGVKGVIKELDTLNSDYVTRIYSTLLLQQADLSEKEALHLLDRLTDLDSDYEKRLALTALITEEKLSDKVLPKVLDAAAVHLATSSAGVIAWASALDTYEGVHAIPLMTIQAKGLNITALSSSVWTMAHGGVLLETRLRPPQGSSSPSPAPSSASSSPIVRAAVPGQRSQRCTISLAKRACRACGSLSVASHPFAKSAKLCKSAFHDQSTDSELSTNGLISVVRRSHKGVSSNRIA